VQQLTETAGHFFTTSPKLESQRDKQEVSDIHETKAVEKLSTSLEPASAQRGQGQEAAQEICPALDTTSSDKSPLLTTSNNPTHLNLRGNKCVTNVANLVIRRSPALPVPVVTADNQVISRRTALTHTVEGRKDGPPISDDATTAPRSSASQGGGQRGSDAGGTAVSSGKDQLLSTEPDDSQLAASELLGADSSGTIQKSPKQNGVKQELGDPGGKELCSLCELPGHTASDCHSLLCEACLQSGHIARDCPTIWCQLCGHKGHTTWNCSKEQKSNSASQIPFQVPQKAAEEKDRATTHPDVALWRLCARYWFPDLLQRAYFVPPVYMNSVLYRQQRVGGLDVDITKAPEANPRKGAAPAAHLSTVREDQAQQHVLHCLQKLAETLVEPMVVISQLQFGDYLGEPCYSAAAKSYPRAADLKDKDKRRGDFDLLFIHKHYGLLVAEIKSVGVSFADLPMEKGREDAVVKTRLQRALQQLCKADDVLTYLVSDLQRPPRVRKTVMLPYITKSQLRRVLADNANLTQSAEHARHHVRLLVFDFSEQSQVEQAVNCLVAASGSGELCIVADEAYKSSRSVFSDFCTELSSKVPGLRLWAASLYHKDKPALLAEAAMTEPLRTPPVVTREVQQSEYVVKGKTGGRMEVIRSYAVSSTPLPTDGPTPVFLYHAGQGHSQGRPGDCEMCGGEVARVLRELHVGPGVPTTSSGSSLGDATTSSTSTGKASQKTADPAIPAPLKYRDVFLLTSLTSSIVEEEKDSAGNVVKPASGIVRGLREAGTPVMVLKKGDKAAVRDVAVMQGPDAIVIASAGLVRGLERKVVVYVQENNTGVNEERWGRLQVMSRTTAKLIIVVWPREPK
ncbi:hypothetical protein BaRGS_00024983, partial [Batillaria attramentaria]